jgi:hypothetical protein
MIEDVRVDIAPQFRGHVTARALIEPKGTIEFRSNFSQVGGTCAGIVFRLISRDYILEVGFTSAHFYILRNDYRLEVPLNPVYEPTGDVRFFATWNLDRLSLVVLDESFDAAIRGLPQPERAEEVKKRRATLKTPPTIPPNDLLVWARQQAILPTGGYDSVETFNETVASSLEAIVDEILALGSSNPFWDISYDGPSISRRRPKREADIHPTIHSLLFYIAIAKKLEITPEYSIAGGRLDFLVSGPLVNGAIANVCIEFKHAHSDDLENGLLKQLPTYMRAKGCSFGIFCVLYFKGQYFEDPKGYDAHSLRINLEVLRRKAGLDNIRTLILDVGHQIPPSRL